MLHGGTSKERADAAERTGSEWNAVACSLPSLLRFVIGPGQVDPTTGLDITNTTAFSAMGWLDSKQWVYARAYYCGTQYDNVTLTGQISLMNTVLGPRYQHLSGADVGLPAVYSFEAGAQAVVLAVYLAWMTLVAVMRLRLLSKNSNVLPSDDGNEYPGGPSIRGTGVRYLHVILALSMLLRLIELAVYSCMYILYGSTGDVVDSLPRFGFVLNLASTGLLALTLLLCSTGWGYIIAELGKNEKIHIGAVGGLYLLCCILRGTCTSSSTIESPLDGAVSCDAVDVAVYVTRSAILLTAVFKINFHLTHLRFTLSGPYSEGWAPSTAGRYVDEERLRVFRRLFLAYLVLPPILFVARIASFGWEYNWLNTLLYELVSISTYGVLCTLFRPVLPPLPAGFSEDTSRRVGQGQVKADGTRTGVHWLDRLGPLAEASLGVIRVGLEHSRTGGGADGGDSDEDRDIDVVTSRGTGARSSQAAASGVNRRMNVGALRSRQVPSAQPWSDWRATVSGALGLGVWGGPQRSSSSIPHGGGRRPLASRAGPSSEPSEGSSETIGQRGVNDAAGLGSSPEAHVEPWGLRWSQADAPGGVRPSGRVPSFSGTEGIELSAAHGGHGR